MEITKEQLYKRQTTLQEIGHQGQKMLLQTKVLVAGCGGLGNAAAVHLAASGIGELHLVDFDTVSTSNLHRQVFYKIVDIGKYKVNVLANHIKSIAPFVKVTISKNAISKTNVFDLIADADYVLDCTDSLPIKYLLNDACVLKNKPLIYGSLYKFDGYVSSFNIRHTEGTYSANLRDAFPDMSKQQVPNCSEVGTLNTIVGIIGLMQANEVLKLVTGIGRSLVNELLIYNSLNNSQFKMKLQLQGSCDSERRQRISEIFEKETYFDPSCEIQDELLLIYADQLKAKLSSQQKDKDLKIISVIEDANILLPFKVDAKIPLSKLEELYSYIERSQNRDEKYVIVCNRGISSYSATQLIKKNYPELRVLSLKGGITNY